MLIRSVELRDVDAITDIYNGYVTGGSATFETEPVGTAEMRSRIAGISARFPLSCLRGGGRVAGYCYAHGWKTKAAYRYTLETTVYLSPDYLGRGIGKRLMRGVDRSVSPERLPGVDSLHYGGKRSQHCVAYGTRVQTSLPF